jgi:uncharacterized repeat protein (TIGR03803 family)
MRSKKMFSAGKPTFAIFITLLLASAIGPTQAHARKFKVLHTFRASDGISPDAQLVRDFTGNLYGTTGTGGSSKCNGGCGTAFKMSGNGKLVWGHNFNGANGETPFPGLLRDATGNLYGTTIYGGNSCGSTGCGVVFKLDKTGKETVLHKFSGPDGSSPVGPLVEDAGGNLYGATQYGSNGGTIFKLDRIGRHKVLYSFGCGSDGCDPGAGVILDAAGNIYGTTFIGGDLNCNPGQGCGVVFKVDASGHETVLHTFGGSDGANPSSSLLLDSAGNLYGTTSYGGNLGCQGGLGCGVVFELSPQSNGTWSETVLYTFCSLSNCADGREPRQGPLIRDSAGNLYGTTVWGGGTGCGGDGCGVVFQLGSSGNESILHNFTGGTDGDFPLVGLTLDREGNLYGAAAYGGAHGDGTVFKISQQPATRTAPAVVFR